jgi:hypothetical protein
VRVFAVGWTGAGGGVVGQSSSEPSSDDAASGASSSDIDAVLERSVGSSWQVGVVDDCGTSDEVLGIDDVVESSGSDSLESSSRVADVDRLGVWVFASSTDEDVVDVDEVDVDSSPDRDITS